MPDNGQSPENEFDRHLEDLGDHVEYPPTPDLAASESSSPADWAAVPVAAA
jgi:hypothetical protein